MVAPIFDDEYKGPRWRYGLTYRPLTGAGVPPGWIVYSARPHPAFRFGTVDYPYELTPAQASQADLTPIA